MRILVVSHAPLVRELGAAQIALSLAGELTARGHEVETWSPESVAPGEGHRLGGRRALEILLEERGPFDLIDAPADLITSRVGSAAVVVARSVQPEILYRKVEVLAELRRRPLSPRTLLGVLRSARTVARILGGWRHAAGVICLGASEADWIRRRFPRLAGRVASYRAAPGTEDRARIRQVRDRRPREAQYGPRRFLWIGRWCAHKGVEELLGFVTRLAEGDRITVAGCGSEGEAALRRLGLRQDRVRVVAKFTRTELPGLLEEHTAGLFTSRVEGWGLSVQEMLESGLPVFATRAGCIPDLEPHLGARIAPFPPDPGADPFPVVAIDWLAYEETFGWPAIARDYLRDIECLRYGAVTGDWRRAGPSQHSGEPGG